MMIFIMMSILLMVADDIITSIALELGASERNPLYKNLHRKRYLLVIPVFFISIVFYIYGYGFVDAVFIPAVLIYTVIVINNMKVYKYQKVNQNVNTSTGANTAAESRDL
jgi:hypothetical protein